MRRALHRFARSRWMFWAFTLYMLGRAIDRLHDGYSEFDVMVLVAVAAIVFWATFECVVSVVKEEWK